MIKQREMNPFCALAVSKAAELGATTIHEAAKKAGISPHRWIDIANGEIPDVAKLSRRAIEGWVISVVHVCDSLDLNLQEALTSMRLPYNDKAIAQARKMAVGDPELGTEELEALIELVKLTGKPVPISFAIRFLAMRVKEKPPQ